MRAHCYAAEVWRHLCCAEGGERIAFALTKQSTSCPLYKQTGYSDQYGYQTHPTVARVYVRARVCDKYVSKKERKTDRQTERKKEGFKECEKGEFCCDPKCGGRVSHRRDSVSDDVSKRSKIFDGERVLVCVCT